MRDIHSSQKPVQSLKPATRTADASGTGVDLQGFEGANVQYDFGTSGDTLSGTVKLQATLDESDDNSTFTAVASDDIIGTLPLVDDPAEDDAIHQVGYRGNKRYIRAGFDFTGTHTNGIPCATTVVKGAPRHGPAS